MIWIAALQAASDRSASSSLPQVQQPDVAFRLGNRKVNQLVVSRDSDAAHLILPRVKKQLHPLRNYIGNVRLAFLLEDKATAVRQPHGVSVDVGQLFVSALGERVVA